MKIIGGPRHWLWLIVLTIIFLIVGDIFYMRYVENTMKRACGGRTVSAGIIRSNMTVFAISIDNKPVYMENDENNDGKIDDIIHLEKGIEQYTTHMDKEGNVKYREIIYNGNKGDKYSLYDLAEPGVFTQRVWQSSEGRMLKEVLVEGRWIPVTYKEPVRSNNSSEKK